jgi:hypothetical protein
MTTEMTDSPMTPDELKQIMAELHWSDRALAKEASEPALNQNTVYRWRIGVGRVPGDIAVWLRELAAFHRANPSPRTKRVPRQPTRKLAESSAAN